MLRFKCYLCKGYYIQTQMYHILINETQYKNAIETVTVQFCKDFDECNKACSIGFFTYDNIKYNKIKEFKLKTKLDFMLEND